MSAENTWPNESNILSAIGGIDSVSDEIRSQISNLVVVATTRFKSYALPSRLPSDGSCPEDARMAIILEAVELLHGYGVGGVISLNDTSLDVGAQAALKKRYWRAFKYADPFPTVRS